MFEITEDHLKLVQRFYWNAEYGDLPADIETVPCVDPKRPFGNSGEAIYGDMAEALGISIQQENEAWYDEYSTEYQYVVKLFNQLTTVMQICTATLSFVPGKYKMTRDYDDQSWVKCE